MTVGLRLARWAWVVAAAATLGLAFNLLDHIWTESRSIGRGAEYFLGERQYQLSPDQANALENIGLSRDWHAAFVTIRFVLVVTTVLVVSTLLWRRARTWAPLFLAWFLLMSMNITTFSNDGSDGELPDWLGAPVLVLFVGGVVSVMGLLFVFPDDHSARRTVPFLVALGAVPLYVGVTENEVVGDWLWNNVIYVGAALLVLGLGFQVSRIRRSGDRTARDLLILTVAMLTCLVGLGFASDNWSGIDGSRRGLASLAWRIGFETAFMAVPLAYGVAVLWILVRRGHWDMDVRLKGSVGYAALTTLLVMSYFGTVAVVQAVANDVSGAEGNTFALMVSTALIAAAILPLRSRLQRLVDRLFERRRRDIDELVEAFETTVVRNARPSDVAGELLAAVDDIFHPEHSELWVVREAGS